MKYDFETRIDRKERGNLKYMVFTPDILKQKDIPSYSGAEFEFRTAPCVMEVVKEAAENGCFGFTLADDNYRRHIAWWLKNVRGADVEEAWITPVLGTIFTVASMVRMINKDDGKMLVLTPGYNRYDQAVRRMKKPATYFSAMIEKDGRYVPDYDDLEEKMRDPLCRLFVFSNPNNPTGQILMEEDLRRILELSRKYDVTIISDEIFADVTLTERRVPVLAAMAEESDKVISTIALGKAFSFSGNNANAIIKNPELREAFEEQKYADHFGSIDPLAYAAHIGGYTAEGKDWLDELIQVIRTNNSLFMDFFRRYRIQVTVPEAGYVLWADFRSLGMEEKELFDFLTNEAYFFVDPGEEYYGTPCNARICTAVPTSEVRKTIKRLEEAFTARGFHAGR